MKLSIIIQFRLFSLLILSTVCLYQVSAQSGSKKEDAITLKDGTIIYGWILEQEIGKSVKLELVGGSILLIEQEKIESIKRVPSRFKSVNRSYNHKLTPLLYRETGLYSYFSLQFSFRDQQNGAQGDVGIHLRLGYRLNRFLALGIGVGVDNYLGGVYMPVYLEINGDFQRKRITPHYQISTGYSIGLNPYWPNDRIEGGRNFFAGMGYKIRTQTKYEWTLIGGYKFQNSSERENAFGAPSGSIFRNVKREGLTMQISIGF